MKFSDKKELMKYAAVMNSDGMKLLLECARCIAGRAKLCKRENELTPQQFDEQVAHLLELVDNNHRRACAV